MSAPTIDIDLLVPGHPFTAGELQAMTREGTLRRLFGDLHCSAADPITARLRAHAVLRVGAPVLAGHWTAVGLTAAWVHAGGSPPDVLEAAVSHFHRPPSHAVSVPLRLREVDVAAPAGGRAAAEEDVLELSGLRCTTVARTVEDLLRVGPGELPPPVWDLAGQLSALCSAEDLRERFERRRRLPGMTAARRRLERLLC